MDSDQRPSGVRIVSPPAETLYRQRLPYFVGISGDTAGSTAISMNLIVIPAGGKAEAHLHRGYETAIYILKGRVETRYGPGLEEKLVCEPGDFVFIAADVPHQPVNLSTTDPAMAVVARNDANEQESVVLYDPSRENPSQVKPE
ncbi:MAG: cupin domain-containing protein [Dehalococcoidia bacterium]|nr:cupin domain-containing protein [Dehalococcoidia bacterium]